MTQLIVQVLDAISMTPEKHVQLLKRGDVIECLPDGMHPGTETMRLPAWRILLVPDLTAFEGVQLLKNEEPEGRVLGDREDPGLSSLKLRWMGLDLDHKAVPSDMVAWLEDFSRRQPCWTCGADIIRRMTVRKSLGPQGPAMIASRARVLG